MIDNSIKKLVTYGIKSGLITEYDTIYITNLIIDALKKDSYSEPAEEYGDIDLEKTLKELCDYAVEKGIIEDSIVQRDLFDTRLIGIMTPPPREIIEKFYSLYEISGEKATDFYYKFSQDTDYIRRYRIKKDMKWTTKSDYGDIDITINLSKPEKDPKDIAAAKNAPQSSYPKCALCRENEGYAGRINAAARQNHRIIPITINNSSWCFQYSPYVYYNEHCIVFNSEHTPMKIDRATFRKLLDFVKSFPHYFVGSNADLPIVGGSILSHDHFQGGRYDFTMAKAPIETKVVFSGYEDVEAGIVKWPMSTIRLRHSDTDILVGLADKILLSWRGYSDESAFIFSETNGEQHNTITPIARMRDGKYELDLVLRNNITTPEHPMGVYHPHSQLHHIKKENIGLIEVMGLAVLPARLKGELIALSDAIIAKKDIRSDAMIAKHADWVDEFLPKYNDVNEKNIMSIIKHETGLVFLKVLEHAGVYKRNEDGKKAFLNFIEYVNR